MIRITEPELMVDPTQCNQFASARSRQRENLFIEKLKQTFELTGQVANLGCGPGTYDTLLCDTFEHIHIDAYDASMPMLDLARQQDNSRISWIHNEFNNINRVYDAVISVDTLHHIHHPQTFWKTINRISKSGSLVFVMDHIRPKDKTVLDRIVNLMSTTNDPVYVTDFRNSLLAAHSVQEIQQQLNLANLNWLTVSTTGTLFQICFITGTKP